MTKQELINRFKLAANKYIENDAWISSALALLSGKSASDIEILSTNKITNRGKLSKFLKEVVSIKNDIKDDELISKINIILEEVDEYYNKKTLTIFCGASSVGKDTVLSELRSRFCRRGIDFEFLSKYTTRLPRLGEDDPSKLIDPTHLEPSGNYSFYDSSKDFSKNKDITLPYELYGHNYGFSKKHLASDAPNLACIYGRLEKISMFREAIERKYNRRTYAVLLTAPANTLISRLSRRHVLNKEEAFVRLNVVHDQVGYIDENLEKVKNDFDVVLDNSYDAALYNVLNIIIESHFLKENLATCSTKSSTQPV